MGHGTPGEPGADGTRTFEHDDRAAIALLHERDRLRAQKAELLEALKDTAQKYHDSGADSSEDWGPEAFAKCIVGVCVRNRDTIAKAKAS